MEISPLIAEKINILFKILKIAEHGAVVIAVCNNTRLRDEIISNLENKCNDLGISFIEVKIDEKNRNLIGILEKFEMDLKFTESKKRVYSATGIEDAVPEALTQLNLKRDYFYDFRYPLILWVKSETVRKIMTIAPDFWHIRAKTIEFIPRDDEVIINFRKLNSIPEFHENKEELLTEIRIHTNLLKSLDESNKNEIPLVLNSLLNLGNLYFKMGDYKKSIVNSKRGLKLAQSANQRSFVSSFTYLMGVIHQKQGNYEEAGRLYRQSLNLFKEMEDRKGIAKTLHQLGNIHYLQGESEEAKKFYDQSLDIIKKIEDKKGIASTLYQLGIIYQDQGNYEEAKKLLNLSSSLFAEIKDKIGVASVRNQLGMIHQKQGNYEEAKKLYGRSLNQFKEIGNKNGIASTLHLLGMVYQTGGNYEEARRLFEKSLKMYTDMGDKNGTATSLGQLGIINEESGDYISAFKRYNEAISMFKELNSPYYQLALDGIDRLKEKIEKEKKLKSHSK